MKSGSYFSVCGWNGENSFKFNLSSESSLRTINSVCSSSFFKSVDENPYGVTIQNLFGMVLLILKHEVGFIFSNLWAKSYSVTILSGHLFTW